MSADHTQFPMREPVKTVLDAVLLEAFFNTSIDGIQILEAVRNKRNKIIDFRYVTANITTVKFNAPLHEERLLLREYPQLKKGGRFERLCKIVQTGTVVDDIVYYPHEGASDSFQVKVQKFGDGLLLSKTSIQRGQKEDHRGDKAGEKMESEVAVALLRSAFDACFDHIAVYSSVRDEKGEIVDFEYVFANKGLEELAGSKVAGKRMTQMFPGMNNPEIFARFKEVVEKNSVADFEEPYKKNDEKAGWFHVTAVKLNDGFVGSWKDITRRKQMEEDIRQLNKALYSQNQELEMLNSELKTFSSIVANNYKETLSNLYTGLEFIIANEAKSFSDAGKANVRRAQSAIQKMKLLTEDIISYSRFHAINETFSAVDLNQTLETVLASMNTSLVQDDVVITVDKLPVLKAYPLLLSVLFYNLIDNATKFRRQAVPLTVEVKYSRADEINREPEALKDTAYHIISVSDSGIGFDEEHSKKIFEMFHRLHPKGVYKGSGVGLTVCRKIMSLHGGFIIAQGFPMQGASFHCFFPIDTTFQAG